MTRTRTAPETNSEGTSVLPERRRFTTAEYHTMSELGILGPEERLELLDGEIFRIAAIGSRHAVCVCFLTEWLIARLIGRALIRVQNPIRLDSGAEPEPDVAIVRLPRRRYARSHPTSEDVFLLIEVADTSLPYDRGRKLPLYARAAIPEMWLVDLERERVYVYREPVGGRYRHVERIAAGGTLTPLAFPDLVLSVEELFANTHPE